MSPPDVSEISVFAAVRQLIFGDTVIDASTTPSGLTQAENAYELPGTTGMPNHGEYTVDSVITGKPVGVTVNLHSSDR
jgi:hypothetical protein